MNHSAPGPGQILDGYCLIRFLGRGGFGEVWLCRSESMGDYHATKFISGNDPDLLEKEQHSLGLYRAAANRLRSPHLVPIERTAEACEDHHEQCRGGGPLGSPQSS